MGDNAIIPVKYIQHNDVETTLKIGEIFNLIITFLDDPKDIAALKEVCRYFYEAISYLELNPHLLPTSYVMRYTENLLHMLNKKRGAFTEFLDQSVKEFKPIDLVEESEQLIHTNFRRRNFVTNLALYTCVYGSVLLTGILLLIFGDSIATSLGALGGVLVAFGAAWLGAGIFGLILHARSRGINRFEAKLLDKTQTRNDWDRSFLSTMIPLVLGPLLLCPTSISNPALYLENSNREKKFKQADIDPDAIMRKNIDLMIKILLPWLEQTEKLLNDTNTIVFINENDQEITKESMKNLIDSIKNYQQLLTFGELSKKENPVTTDEEIPLLLSSPKEEDIDIKEKFQKINTIETLVKIQTGNTTINQTIDEQFKNVSEKLMALGLFKGRKEEEKKEQSIVLQLSSQH